MNRNTRFLIYTILVLAFVCIYLYAQHKSGLAQNSQTSSGIFIPNKQTKFSNCHINGKYPDPACTPGAYIETATKDKICTPGYAKSVRDVKEEEKEADYEEYGITHHTAGQYEIDHFISLELGGSNDIANLFPEAAEPKPGFHEKDKVENYLHDEVCSGTISLNEARREIATDWYAVYQKIQ